MKSLEEELKDVPAALGPRSVFLEPPENYRRITPAVLDMDPHFFNNFKDNLPGGRRRDPAHFELIRDEVSGGNEYNSERKKQETAGVFFGTIDTAIQESGLDGRLVEGLTRATTTAATTQQKIAAARELLSYVLPLYMKLRDQGYTHYDLVG